VILAYVPEVLRKKAEISARVVGSRSVRKFSLACAAHKEKESAAVSSSEPHFKFVIDRD